MRKTAAAALALMALVSTAASANPGNGNGGGNGNGKHGVGNKVHGNPGKAMKSQGNSSAMKVEKSVQRQVIKAGGPQFDSKAKPVKAAKNAAVQANREVRAVVSEPRIVGDRGAYVRMAGNDCPPGLAKKFNGCMPPGLAKRDTQVYYDRPDWWGYSSLPAGRYRYDNGYLLTLGSNNRISGFVPLLAGALTVGDAWPDFYRSQPLDTYYQSYYDLGPVNSYRYADDVIYRVDPQTAVIGSIAALLTGDTFTVGQRMPIGYDIYNVPYAYRDRYYDTPDMSYRYANGYIYQVDPKTQLIAAAISLLT